MPELVALRMTPGPGYLAAVDAIWERGDAVLPLDDRLPAAWVQTLLERLRPTILVDNDGSSALSDGVGVEPGDAVVIATSGTTGDPKGVVHTHAALSAAAEASNARLGIRGGSASWLCCLPVHHIAGFSVMSRSLLGGGRCTVLPRFDPHAVETAARDGARFVSLVPTALDRINAQLFERILLGGSAIPAVRPANTVATYGMTETVGGVVYEGRPLDGVRVRIRDGVAEFNSPTLLRCYRDGSVPLTAGWYRTGDVATLDESGLQIHGRADDLIISGGENVWPGPVENILGRHPKVAAVAVVGRPDEAWGERVVAVVVPSDPHDPPTVSELRLLVKAQLPAWNAPASLEIVEALPTTALGKVRRHQL